MKGDSEVEAKVP